MSTADPSQRLTRSALLEAFASYGRSRQHWLVGGEFERHLLDSQGQPAPYEGHHSVRDLLQRFVAEDGWRPYREGSAPIMLTKDGASITLEPGGQFELSGRPHSTIGGVVDEARRFNDDVDRHLAGGPLKQVALGYTPYARMSDVGWVPKGRYAVMRAHMAKSGELGHHMMKGTAATQASFDFSDEADCARKARIGIVLAPLVTAMFANSPFTQGRRNGFHSFRGWIWTKTDPARTGFPEAASSFSFERWIDYLLDVPMMFAKRNERWVSANGWSFRRWMEQGDSQGRYPTWPDWDLHLTSVFPEVRIKKQIEVRMGDCVSLDLAGAFVALFTGLFYCNMSLEQATAIASRFERFGTKEERFVIACRQGLHGMVGGHSLAAWAEELVTAAYEGLGRCAPGEQVWLDPLVALVEHGENPATQLLAAVGDTPEPAALIAATHPHG